MLRRPRESHVSSCLYLKQNTDRLQRKQPTPLRFPPKKHTRKKADTTNQGRALTAATRKSRGGPKRPGRAHCKRKKWVPQAKKRLVLRRARAFTQRHRGLIGITTQGVESEAQ